MKIDRSGALALFLVVTTATLCLAPPAHAVDSAAFAGRVLAADGVSPLSGATIVLLDVDQRLEYRSAATHKNGGFALDVPPGTYTILIETADGAYLASDGLALKAGQNPPLLLAISTDAQPAAPAGLAAEGGWPTWVKWVVVGAIVVVGVVVTTEVTDEEETPGTPF